MLFKKRIIVTAIASIAWAGTAGLVLAQVPDVRQEDRAAERAAGDVRQEDRAAERAAGDVRREDRGMENEMEARNNGVEVKIALPRTDAGAVDVTTLLADIQTQVGQGAREIQFRGAKAGDLQGLVLSSDSMQSVLAQIGALLPSDGIERSVTLRGADGSRVRVQRADNGTLRARIENIGGLTADQLAQIQQQLAALGFTRVRIDSRGGNGGSGRSMASGSGRGRDHAEANDVRREDRRADRAAERAAGDVRQEDRDAEGANRRGDRVARVDRPDRIDRPDKVDRPDRMDRPDKVDRPDRSGRH
ncbi:MAG TPA: hypothetical protein VK572_16965 [Burkholderiales bacterium]|nr:hypothetical protein [Burkholderiales bacterium]